MDMALYAIIMAKVKKALIDGGNVTPEEREKIDKLIIDGLGDKYLSDDGTYKDVSGGTTDYENLNNKPSINGNELTGNKTASQLGFSSVASTGSYDDLTGKPTPITMLSQLSNDTGFIDDTVNNLVNYWRKTETYNKTQVDSLINTLTVVSFMIVDELPTTEIGLTVIYLIKEENKNSYVQWMYLNNTWANLGTTEVDLTNYYTKAETNTLLNSKVSTQSGYGLSQENYSSVEKSKLAGLSNYVLPEATTSVLGGVKIDGTTIVKDSNGVISSVGGSGGDIIDDNAISLAKTWSSEKINSEIEVVGEIANDINIAQKTVNTRGIKELLNNEVLMTIGTSATTGTPVTTIINQNITLKESIANYDFVNIQFTVKSAERKYNFPTKLVNVKNIIYNNTNIALNDGSVILFEMNLPSGVPGSYGSLDVGFRGWFKSPTQLFIIEAINPMGDLYNVMSIQSIEGVNIENITIDPVEYVNTTQGIEDTPVGHILSQMGKTAPKHYLICDGTTYNILDYSYLSQYIKDQFGTFNFFGGDGSTTFAVPDLRGEFLRGTGTATRNTGTGANVGAHQDGTNLAIPFMLSGFTQGRIPFSSNITNIDKTISTTGQTRNFALSGGQDTADSTIITARPTNTSVLYCIKYEPTYFMSIQGMIEETTLWEGNVGSSTTTPTTTSINLNNSYNNYDKIGFWYNAYYGSTGGGDNVPRPQYREVLPEMINYIRSYPTNSTLSLTWSYGGNADYTTIQKTSTDTRFEISQMLSRLLKVVGIKYKTFQN